MKVSVYTIYVVACLLACGAAVVSGIFLLNTFAGQQREAENTQLRTGLGQVRAIQTMVCAQMQRLRKCTEANAKAFFYQTADFPPDQFAPDVVLSAVNDTIFSSWVPRLKAPDQLSGHGISFVYTDPTTGEVYDRTLQVYWDLRTSGKYEFAYAATSLDDGLCHARRIKWPGFATPRLGAEMYAFGALDAIADTYTRDDFYDFAKPWAASDGNSYWSYTHLQAFVQNGVWVNFQTWGSSVEWVDMMRSVLTAGANFAVFDSQRYVIAATTPAELARLARCHAPHNGTNASSPCVQVEAHEHPTQEIREVYTALYAPSWDALGAEPIAPSAMRLTLGGQQYMAIVETLFSKDNLRVTVVWYQPWVSMQGDSPLMLMLVCILTVLSTFLLTLLGIFGVLRPMMALGGVMRDVVHSLQDGATETVLDQLKSSVFYEVDDIGRDFETIVADFLGFSYASAKDIKNAPKDPKKPFAVVCLDIAYSAELWDCDPVQMSRCIQECHGLLRQLIQKHRLYEVSMENGKALVASASAQTALLFALDVQTTLFDHQWGWAGAEELYRQATLTGPGVGQPLSAVGDAAPTDTYATSWNGLRCQVGVHYGTGDLTYDEAAKMYKYFGAVVDTAACIQSLAHGGQVLVSQAVLDALPAPMGPDTGLATPVGDVFLRGLGDVPALVEVKPPRLTGRAFPPLRVEQEEELLSLTCRLSGSLLLHRLGSAGASEDVFSSTGSTARLTDTNTSLPSRDTPRRAGPGEHTVLRLAQDVARNHALVQDGRLSADHAASKLLALYRVVEVLLRPLAPPQYAAVTRALARAWRVPPPRAKADFPLGGLHLARAVSERTSVFEQFTINHDPPQQNGALGSRAELPV